MLSIIVPVYNTEKYLAKCLDSIIQALEKVEIKTEVLVINDGSTDNSKIVIEKYKNEHPQLIAAYDKPNGGLSDVKNFGLDHAKGEFISFIDSDDFVDPEMFYDMMNGIMNSSADAAVCDIKLVYDDKTERVWPCTNSAKTDAFEAVIDMPMMASSCNKIIRKSLFDGIYFPKGINNEDIAVTPIVLGRISKIVIINKPYYNYYQRSGSIQNGEFNERRFAILQTARLCIDNAAVLGKEKQNIIKNSLYAHQILALALYPVREQKFGKRLKLLKEYMRRIHNTFPDFWRNMAVLSYGMYDGRNEKIFKQLSIKLLSHKCYFGVSCFWSIVNMILKV